MPKMTKAILFLLLLASEQVLPQLESPPRSDDEEYQPPNFGRGLGTVSDDEQHQQHTRRLGIALVAVGRVLLLGVSFGGVQC